MRYRACDPDDPILKHAMSNLDRKDISRNGAPDTMFSAQIGKSGWMSNCPHLNEVNTSFKHDLNLSICFKFLLCSLKTFNFERNLDLKIRGEQQTTISFTFSS